MIKLLLKKQRCDNHKSQDETSFSCILNHQGLEGSEFILYYSKTESLEHKQKMEEVLAKEILTRPNLNILGHGLVMCFSKLIDSDPS